MFAVSGASAIQPNLHAGEVVKVTKTGIVTAVFEGYLGTLVFNADGRERGKGYRGARLVQPTLETQEEYELQNLRRDIRSAQSAAGNVFTNATRDQLRALRDLYVAIAGQKA